jgi:carboxypeptidase Taq
MRTKQFDHITDTLLPDLKNFLQSYAIPIAPPAMTEPLAIPPAAQLNIMEQVIRDMGFDFSQGRLDVSLKAFFEKTDHDRRIVTRIDPANVMAGLSSAVHETGHALHYQYLPHDWRTQPVGRAGDYCMREAVAFIWQIFVAQTPEFHIYLSHYLRDMAGLTVDPAALFLSQNTIRPSPLRIGSDPATYALHILIRYRIERDLVNGQQDVKNLPQRWAEEYRDALMVDVPDHVHGVLQDIHWYKGSFGYFPCYLLALLYAAQLFHKAKADIPDLVTGFASLRAARKGLTAFLPEQTVFTMTPAPEDDK